MEINSYIDQIVFWVTTCAVALAGSSGGIAWLLNWVKNKVRGSVDNLSTSKADYEEKAAKLDALATNLGEASDTMKKVSGTLEGFAKEISTVKCTCDDSKADYNRIVQAISLMAENDSYLVSNGVAKQITDILGTTKAVNTIDEVTEDETDA